MLLRLSLVISLFTFSSLSKAADSSSGCGPAWYIIKDKSLLSSFARFLTNGFLSPVVTLGMTFGTSNCSKHSIVEKNKQSEHFLTVAFDKLRQNAAQGEGPFLDAYAKTFACKETAIPLFHASIQRNYSLVFGKSINPQDIVDLTKDLVARTPELAKSCVVAT